jgi:hypothetical protein
MAVNPGDAFPILGGGYNSTGVDLIPFPVVSTSSIPTSSLYVQPTVNDTKIWHPPTPAVPGTTTTYTAPSVINKLLNKGWNSWARSINPLVIGEACVFTVMSGVSGTILGIGPAGIETRGPGAFSHSIVCDVSGVHIRENNTQIKTLKDLQTAVSILRIHRQEDGSIVYVATTGTETLVYTSLLACPKYLTLYVYGLLYSSGDKVTATQFADYGDVQYGAC